MSTCVHKSDKQKDNKDDKNDQEVADHICCQCKCRCRDCNSKRSPSKRGKYLPTCDNPEHVITIKRCSDPLCPWPKCNQLCEPYPGLPEFYYTGCAEHRQINSEQGLLPDSEGYI